MREKERERGIDLDLYGLGEEGTMGRLAEQLIRNYGERVPE